MTSADSSERFSKWLSAVVAPTLARHGFRKRGATFHLRGPDGWGLVNFQKSQFGTKHHVRFYINLGVALDRLLRLDGADPGQRPPEYRCHWRARLEMLTGRDLPGQWDLNDAVDLGSLSGAILPPLEDALPVLRGLLTEEGFLAAIASPHPHSIVRPPPATIRAAFGVQSAHDIREH